MHEQDDVIEYGLRRWLIVIGVMSATLLQVLDATIVNVALPSIQGNLGANFDSGAWIVTGYIIAAVIVIPLTPWLQRLMGRRNYYVAAIAGFTVTSALCGFSTSLTQLVTFRVLQGLCGGGLISTGQAIMRDTFPARQLGLSQALTSIGAIIGPSIGPTLGGVLTDSLSWNWVFYINIVPGIASAVLCFMLLRDPSVRGRTSLDGIGLALMATGLGCLQYVLDEGERYDWFNDRNIVATALLSVGSLVTFVYWELKVVKNPIVDIGILLKNRTVAAGCLLAMSLAFALFGGVILAPQFQQLLLNFTATLSGLSIFVRAIGIMIMTPITLMLLNRAKIKPQVLLGVGFVLVAIANLINGQVLTTDSDFNTFLLPLFLGGIGFGMIFVPLSVSVLTSVKGADTQKATSLLSLCQQLGGSISTAVLVTMLDRRGAFHMDALAAHVNLASPAVQHVIQAHGSMSAVAAIVAQQASTMSFADAFYFLGVVSLVLTPLVMLLRPAKAPKAAMVGASE
ncbi:MAG TPA: DHA2 family efflux MFS transporter permease subunit [Candidatus Baltobacteraceae bacterium]|jgi:DHA2 family multidrug resistance protein|nr:DHA2 family efflux MFS transporter permease subunit [Candidatus Baltobacteraceae bacterium]